MRVRLRLGRRPARRRRRAALAPAQHGADAGQQLARVARLGEIILGAHLQPDDAIDIGAHRREHDDRRRRPPSAARAARSARPRAASSRRARSGRSVRGASFSRISIGLPRRVGAEAVLVEEGGHQLADALVVIDDQDAGGEVHRRGEWRASAAICQRRSPRDVRLCCSARAARLQHRDMRRQSRGRGGMDGERGARWRSAGRAVA